MPVMVRCVSMKVSNNAHGVMALTMLDDSARQTTTAAPTAAPTTAARMWRQEEGGRGKRMDSGEEDGKNRAK